MKLYKIKYKCKRCIGDTTYTWRTSARSAHEARAKFYDTEVKGWEILQVVEC